MNKVFTAGRSADTEENFALFGLQQGAVCSGGALQCGRKTLRQILPPQGSHHTRFRSQKVVILSCTESLLWTL